MTLTNVKYKVGFYNRFFSKIFLDHAYKKDRKDKHVTFQRIDLLNKSLGINSTNYWPDISVDNQDTDIANKFLLKNKIKKFVCIVPDASLESKQWPLERFKDLIIHILKKHKNYKIVLLGADSKKIGWLARNKSVIAPEKSFSLRVTYLLFKKSSLVIAHDGGPMHLAWAAKSKLIALMPRHLNLKYYGPLNKDSRVISDTIRNISVRRVSDYVDELLKE